MILEAMKMENNILADGNGKIAEILVQKETQFSKELTL